MSASTQKLQGTYYEVYRPYGKCTWVEHSLFWDGRLRSEGRRVRGHILQFGTFPRGHFDTNSHCSKKTRDKRRTKNRLARIARKANW